MEKDAIFAHRERLYRRHGNEIFSRSVFWQSLGPFGGAWLKCQERKSVPTEVTNFFQPYQAN